MSDIAIDIVELEKECYEQFFIYLNDHLSDNGLNSTPLFQPQSRNHPGLSSEKASIIQRELLIPIGEPKWRRLWIALHRDERKNNKEIVGHIDLRSHGSLDSKHRALLGMGIHRDFRRRGLGQRLLAFVYDWVIKVENIEYLDLWVLSNNKPAISFYQKENFKLLGQIDDMFRIDGQSEGQLFMSRKISTKPLEK